MSQLRKYVPDPSHVIQSDDVQVRDNLTVETLPVRIDDRKTKTLRRYLSLESFGRERPVKA